MKMGLYLISQTCNTGYDTYDSAVVAAETPMDAKKMHPGGARLNSPSSWTDEDSVEVKYLGDAAEGTKSGVICASYNGG
jgi:hypothetical protein